MALKRPHAIAFNKKNDIHPFDAASTSVASLEFWSQKNDASMFIFGQTTKKRPHGLTFVRMFDNKVLDMAEVGVESWTGMADFKVSLSAEVIVCNLFNPYYRHQNPPQDISH